MKLNGVIVLLAIASACTSAAAKPDEPLDIRVPFAPVPLAVNGTSRLVYEVHVANTSEVPLRLTRVAVDDAHDGSAILQLSGDALAHATAQLETPPSDPASSAAAPAMVMTSAVADPLALEPGARVVVYLEIDLAVAEIPDSLVHRIDFARANARSGEDSSAERGDAVASAEGAAGAGRSSATSVTAASVAVRDDAPPVLGPPVTGGPWVAVHHPSWPRGHRRVLYRVAGRERIPGRFAVDWIRVDPGGRTVRGDRDVVADWIGHRVEVLAVADAEVIATRDDVAESGRISTHPDHPLEDATGNYIALDLGNGRYAFYEHLAPGSIRVARGERVRRGQPIAALGYTGHSTSPHLHFHVADGSSPLGAEGVPFLLECFELLGDYESLDALGSAPWTPLADTATRVRRREMPAPNVVIDPHC